MKIIIPIQHFIDYIDARFKENPYEGTWVTDQGERIPADVCYAAGWWEECMKPELLRKFDGGGNALWQRRRSD